MSASARLRIWRDDAIAFVKDNFGVEPDAWQARALRVLCGRETIQDRIALLACAGPGKTAFLAWAGWYFLATQGERGEHPKGAAVSVTSDNLKDNLWPELSKWQQRSEFLRSAFVWTKERIYAKDHESTWWLSARGYSKSADKETQGRTLSGLHSKYILYLIDESGDMPSAILRSAEQGLSTGPTFGKIVTAGNPTSLDGLLYYASITQAGAWSTVKITGDPDDPERSPRIDIEWARQQIKLWGRDNPWVMSYILGQFPPSSINQLITLEEVEAAMARELRPDVYAWSQKRQGIDVARFGDDRTCIFPRQGLMSWVPVVMRHKPTDTPSVDIANRVINGKNRWGSEREYFDDTVGWAHGALDIMRSQGHAPMGLNYSSTRTPDPRYYNIRAYLWSMMALWIKRGGKLPNMPELKRELIAPTYTYQNGKLLLESKDQIKERLGYSPDLADALANTFGEPDCPAKEAQILMGGNQGKLVVDYDPYAYLTDDGRVPAANYDRRMMHDYDPLDSNVN